MPRAYPARIQQAFDELRFGPSRTLNLRSDLPTADEARLRAERWLRGKQIERAEDVLVITGRGKHSEGGMPAVRQAILALFPSLRRRNVILGWTEHTAGSFVVTLAPVRALFDAPKRRREPRGPVAPTPPSLADLTPETLTLLRRLAIASLALLGIHDTDQFVESEMMKRFADLSSAVIDDPDHDGPDHADPELALQHAIRSALNELDDLA